MAPISGWRCRWRVHNVAIIMHEFILRRVLAGTAALMLCGCISWSTATAPEAGDQRPPLLAGNQLHALLAYTESVRLLTPRELGREYARTERGYSKEANPAERVKLAIILSLRHAPFRDEARARGLLLQAAADTGYNAAEYRALAELLLAALDERRELERSLEEERRKRAELDRKLQQLKAIEEEIDRRTAAP
jgi:hypothetical protein